MRLGLPGERLQARVLDNGSGIPPSILPRIFDPFFTTRMGTGGSGLGLHLVYNLVTSVLRGQVRAASTVAQGSSFDIEIPCAPADANVATAMEPG